MIRVLIADDNPVIRQGLTALLATAAGIEVVGEAATGREAVDLAERHVPDVVLLDVRMPVMDGVTAAARLADAVRVVMLTYADEPETIRAAVRAGACGYLVHGRFDRDDLTGAIRRAAADAPVVSDGLLGAVFDALRAEPGGSDVEPDDRSHPLTEREAEVMDRIAQGLSNGEIAEALFISEKTVKNHINRIYTKLDVSSRARAIARWLGTHEEERR